MVGRQATRQCFISLLLLLIGTPRHNAAGDITNAGAVVSALPVAPTPPGASPKAGLNK
jgi:hypothetical protein